MYEGDHVNAVRYCFTLAQTMQNQNKPKNENEERFPISSQHARSLLERDGVPKIARVNRRSAVDKKRAKDASHARS